MFLQYKKKAYISIIFYPNSVNLMKYWNIHFSLFVFSSIKREKRPPSPEDDDVIILSDNDSPSPPMNGLSHFKELDTDLLMVRNTPTQS